MRPCIAAMALLLAAFGLADVEGVVVDDSGKPVSGAVVWLTSRYGWWGRLKTIGQVRTDASGLFRFRCKVLPDPRRFYHCAAFVGGAALAVRWVKGQDPFVRLTVGPSGGLNGQVVDERRQPIAGARVELVGLRAACNLYWEIFWRVPAALGPVLRSTTDADGNFSLPWLIPGYEALIAISAPGRPRVEKTVSYGEPLRVVLRRAAAIDGRVVCEQSPESVRGLKVEWLCFDPAGGLSNRAIAVTDETGHFRLERLMPAGEGVLRLSAPASSPWQAPAVKGLELKPGEVREIAVKLQRGVPVEGRVVDAATGRAFAGIEVQLRSRGVTVRAKTDSSGRYQAYVLPGNLMLQLGRAPAGYLLVGPPLAQFRVADDAAGPVKAPPLRLQHGVGLAGRVVDARGRGVSGASIFSVSHFSGSLLCITGRDGRFRTGGLAPGRSLELTALADGLVSDKPVSVRLGKKGGRAVLRLSRSAACRLRAVVVDDSGKPVAGAPITINASLRAGDVAWTTHFFGGLTDEQGNFVSGPLIPLCKYALAVRLSSAAVVATEWWNAERGREHDFGRLVVRLARGVGAGRVVDGREGRCPAPWCSTGATRPRK